MNKKTSRHPQGRRNIIRPVPEASSTANEQLQLYVTRALREMIPLCSRKDIHHHRSIALRLGDYCISIEVSVTPWNTPFEAPEFLERM